AYVIASGGAKDLDGSNGFFDLGNGESTAGNPGFNAPNRIQSTSYDDLSRALSLNELNQKNCTGGGGSGGGGGPPGVENTDVLCSDGLDNDGDGFIDCYDQDCCGAGLTVCPQCPPSTNIQINTNPVPPGTGKVGETFTHTFQAAGGSGYYYGYVDSIAPNIPGATISLWNGTLSGTIDNCAGSYAVNVRVEDRYDASKTDSHAFTLSAANGTLTVTPSPNGGGAGNPDFTVDGSTFAQVFTINGGHVGDFNWTINWQGGDPGGFQISDQSETEGKLSKSAATTPGNFTFTLTATDATCPTNTFTTNSYSVTITPVGAAAPYSANLTAEWRLDECSWNGTPGEVADSGDKALDGTAVGDATTAGTGRFCRAGLFDGSGDYMKVDSTSDLKLTTPFSIALWVKVNNTPPSWARLVGKGSSTNRNYGIWLNSAGQILFQIYSNGGTGQTYGTGVVNDGRWHHIVCVYDLATLKVYIDNGLPVSVNYAQIPRTSDDPLTIGGTDWGNYFDGMIDEVMLFNKALPADSATETSVKTIYELTRPTCSGSCYTPPIAEYRMDNFPWTGAAAGEVVDSGSGGSNGIAAAEGSGTIPTQTDPLSGKVCRAGIFTRVDDNNGGYLDLGDPTDGDLDPGTSPWTISAWIKWNGAAGDNIIYNKENLYEARVNGGYLQYAWRPHWAWDGGTSFPVTTDTWTHVTLVYDGHQQVLYKDGTQVYARNQTGAMGTTTSKLLIGARGSSSPRYFFGGQIDEVRIYNRGLAENEIQADMTATHTCP
ncbi:MAG: LamG domain-containing protein, partial [Desulfatiglandaceae bacterium]